MNRHKHVAVLTGLALLCGAVLAQTPPAGASSAPHTEGRRAEHFEQAKQFAVRSLNERVRILNTELQCVQAATAPAALRACHDTAQKSRESLKSTLKPQLEQIRQHAPR